MELAACPNTTGKYFMGTPRETTGRPKLSCACRGCLTSSFSLEYEPKMQPTEREREREREREKKPWHSKHGLKPPYEFITVRLRAFFLRTSALRMIYCDRGYSTRLEESSSLYLSGFSLIKARRFLADLSWDSLTDKSFRRILLISPLSNN